MVAKLIITVFAALFFVGFTTGATKRCESQRDCKDSECCSKRFMHPEAYCVQRRKLNEICIADELGSSLINGKYDITCPCAGDLKCIEEKYIGPNGFMITKGLPRCREPNYAGSSDNDYNPYNNEASSSANSYGNNNNYNPYGKKASASSNSYGNSNSNSYAYSQS